MAENNTLLRTVTIGLDEYNTLKDKSTYKDEIRMSLEQQVTSLRQDLIKKEAETPKVEVRKYGEKKGPWGMERTEKIDFINMSEAKEMLKKEVEKESETELKEKTRLIKELRNNVDTLQDKIDSHNKSLLKNKVKCNEELSDLREKQEQREKELSKAYEADVKNYKEHIKDLKEEIQKVKDSKTDVELEEKRNREIKDLKGRIKDLETFIENYNSMSFFKRVFSKSVKEYNEQYYELIRRERAADAVGITYVKENGKIRKYDSFKDRLNQIRNKTSDYIQSVYYSIANSTNRCDPW